MSSPLEEQLRAAGRAVAGQVTDVPELRTAPTRPTARRQRPWGRPGRRWTAWAVPVAAMVAIAALAVTSVVVRNAVGRGTDQVQGAPWA